MQSNQNPIPNLNPTHNLHTNRQIPHTVARALHISFCQCRLEFVAVAWLLAIFVGASGRKVKGFVDEGFDGGGCRLREMTRVWLGRGDGDLGWIATAEV